MRMPAKGPPKQFSLSIMILQRVKEVGRRRKKSVITSWLAVTRRFLNGQHYQLFNAGRQEVRKKRPRRWHLQRLDCRKGEKGDNCWFLSFPCLPGPRQSRLDVLGSLINPYAHGLDVFFIPFCTQQLDVGSHACVVFQVATAYDVTFHCVGKESGSKMKICLPSLCEHAKKYH